MNFYSTSNNGYLCILGQFCKLSRPLETSDSWVRWFLIPFQPYVVCAFATVGGFFLDDDNILRKCFSVEVALKLGIS